MIRLYKYQAGFDPASFIIYAIAPGNLASLRAIVGDVEPITRREAATSLRRLPRTQMYLDGEAPATLAGCLDSTARLIS